MDAKVIGRRLRCAVCGEKTDRLYQCRIGRGLLKMCSCDWRENDILACKACEAKHYETHSQEDISKFLENEEEERKKCKLAFERFEEWLTLREIDPLYAKKFMFMEDDGKLYYFKNINTRYYIIFKKVFEEPDPIQMFDCETDQEISVPKEKFLQEIVDRIRAEYAGANRK